MSEYTRDQIEAAVLHSVESMDTNTLMSIVLDDLQEFYRKSATQEEINELMELHGPKENA